VAPLGFLMGSQTPLGVKAIASRAPELVPWCWGLGGFAAVVASGTAPLVALNFGFAAVLLIGGVCYLAAALLAPDVAAETVARTTDVPGTSGPNVEGYSVATKSE
jgi:hypothetical protein